MKNGLNSPVKGDLDFLSLGALVIRLDPGVSLSAKPANVSSI